MNAHQQRRICLGAVAAAHGVRGEVKIKTFTEAPEAVAAYGPVETEDGRRLTLTVVRTLKDGLVLARAQEIKTREGAEALKGARLYVGRERLPAPGADEFYHEDLVGLAAFDDAGAPFGMVSAVYNFGAGDIIELKGVPGADGVRLVAFTRENVPAVDLDNGRIVVAAAVLAEVFADDNPIVSDETGEIVSDDLGVDLDAMREEDA